MPVSIRKALLVLGCLLGAGSPFLAANGPESVVVVANSAVPGSLEVAEYYLELRDIPRGNLILLETGTGEGISREAYINGIHNPVLDTLLERDLINALTGQRDRFGRKSVTMISSRVSYLVLCYGVPVRVENSPLAEVDDLSFRRALFSGTQAGLVERFSEGRLARNVASVDGELALLLRRKMPLNGFIPNPYFRNSNPGAVRDILKVTRLDGPSPEAVKRMLRNSIEGERKGLAGRAYVDEDGRGGGFKIGNDWLARTARLFETLGFDLEHDSSRATFPEDARFDAPVLYGGWYARSINGPFTLPGFRFPPGAVAAHLHSSSARPLRSTTSGWVGPFVERGVSATFGNVAEPYLRFTHHFDLFFECLASGLNFADAAYLALPVLSWQAVSIGDPLFRPFALPLEEQAARTGNPLDSLRDQYVLLRQVNRLRQSDDSGEALTLAGKAMRRTPGPALALRQAQLLAEDGDGRAALRALAYLSELAPTESGEWGLHAHLADTLHRLGESESALRIYRRFENLPMPEELRLAFLKRGIQVAKDAGEHKLAADWTKATAPPPEDPPSSPSGNSAASDS
ncbi:MAG TPA: TIGR03790 family protein [Oceanipulchritudo sp.]|nr:TIGR03790 family protein [Oceanipulchritudo sp.]